MLFAEDVDKEDKERCFTTNGLCMRRRTKGFTHAPAPPDAKMEWFGICLCCLPSSRDSYLNYGDSDPDDNSSINSELVLSMLVPNT